MAGDVAMALYSMLETYYIYATGECSIIMCGFLCLFDMFGRAI